ncbi:MAG: hypothetical protein JKY13_02460 [Gammaproteobacteria bacterium]|nr:hypothetical protein [Gammaproteobacteria bacterium]
MLWLKTAIEVMFNISLFVSALLFIPQIFKLVRLKHANELSLIMFRGFYLYSYRPLTYDFLKHDYILIIGYRISMLTCGTATLSILFIGKNKIFFLLLS